jgi:hypothetical protein
MCCRTLLQAAFCWVRLCGVVSPTPVCSANHLSCCTLLELSSALSAGTSCCLASNARLFMYGTKHATGCCADYALTVLWFAPCGAVSSPPKNSLYRQAVGASGAVCCASPHPGLCGGAAGATTCPAPGSKHHAGGLLLCACVCGWR